MTEARDEMIRPGAEAPIETKVTTAKLERHSERCAHGFEVITVDDEQWHQDGVELSRQVWVPCDGQPGLLYGAYATKKVRR